MKEIYNPPGMLCEGCRLSINGKCRCPMEFKDCPKPEKEAQGFCDIEVDFDELRKGVDS